MYITDVVVIKRQGNYVLAHTGTAPGGAADYATFRVAGNGVLLSPIYTTDLDQGHKDLRERYEDKHRGFVVS